MAWPANYNPSALDARLYYARKANRQRAHPAGHATPAAAFAAGGTTTAGQVTRTAAALFSTRLALGATARGVIYEQGSATVGALVGIDASRRLVVRIGSGASSPSSNFARGVLAAPLLPTGQVNLAWAFKPDSGITVWVNGALVLATAVDAALAEWADNGSGGSFLVTSLGTLPNEPGVSDFGGGFTGMQALAPLLYYQLNAVAF